MNKVPISTLEKIEKRTVKVNRYLKKVFRNEGYLKNAL